GEDRQARGLYSLSQRHGPVETQIAERGSRRDCAQYQHRSRIDRVMPVVKEQPIISFPTAEKWRAWLERNSVKSFGVRPRLFKKNSGKKSVTRDEALDEALCYGWIDGQADKYDDESWLQKFTPRRPRSMWSKRNRDNVPRLFKESPIQTGGL